MELNELAAGFFQLFAGNKRGYGQYTIKGQEGLKAKGVAQTIAKEPTIELWEKHLEGKSGLGIVPIQENGSCTWGAVDIDEYEGLDLDELSTKLPAPLVMCRTKSGGVHVYIFMRRPTGAALMRKKLTMVARALGFPTAEIFPKQEKLEPGDIGNWINMPYFNQEISTRYCMKSGIILSSEEFLALAQDNSLDQEALVALNIESIHEYGEDPEFDGAPPCLKYFIKHGFPKGSMNNALFSMGVFARKKFASGWEDKIWDYNMKFMGPGKYSEVAAVIRSLNKKTYVYKCKDQPCASRCDKDACSLEKYGVAQTNTEEKSTRPCVLDSVDVPVICYEPPPGSKDDPYWVFVIDGKDFDVTVEMAYSQPKFNREYSRIFKRIVLPVKDTKWVNRINEILETAEVRELGSDAGPEGRFWQHLEEFCSVKVRAQVKDELIVGKPWAEDSRIYFRLNYLAKFLDQQRFRAFESNEIVQVIKRRDGQHHDFNLKGKHIACWSVPDFTYQNEPFEKMVVPDDTSY